MINRQDWMLSYCWSPIHWSGVEGLKTSSTPEKDWANLAYFLLLANHSELSCPWFSLAPSHVLDKFARVAAAEAFNCPYQLAHLPQPKDVYLGGNGGCGRGGFWFLKAIGGLDSWTQLDVHGNIWKLSLWTSKILRFFNSSCLTIYPKLLSYGGWKKSESPVDRWFNPIIYRVSTIQGDAGFLPSTVWLLFDIDIFAGGDAVACIPYFEANTCKYINITVVAGSCHVPILNCRSLHIHLYWKPEFSLRTWGKLTVLCSFLFGFSEEVPNSWPMSMAMVWLSRFCSAHHFV